MAYHKYENNRSKYGFISCLGKKGNSISSDGDNGAINNNVPGLMAKGSIDMWFMLIVLALLCFGAVMSFSASAVYAKQHYGESAYFLWRYIMFAAIAIIGTVPFIMWARPWFW